MRLKKKIKGIAVIYVAISMTALLLFAALVTDIGILALNKNRVQNACDAAALAGAKELPKDTAKAKEAAENYALVNGINKVNVEFSTDNTEITVTADKQVDFFFARIVDIKNGTASVKATAQNAPITKIRSNLIPFGVVDSSFSKTPGEVVVLRQCSTDGTKGNFQSVQLNDNPGTPGYVDAIKNGSSNSYSVGDKIPTLTGLKCEPSLKAIEDRYCPHTPQCTYVSYIENCPSVVVIPLIDSLDISGKKTVVITGFAVFLINKASISKDWDSSDDTTEKGKGHIEITGTFVKIITEGEISTTQVDTGVRGVKLIE